MSPFQCKINGHMLWPLWFWLIILMWVYSPTLFSCKICPEIEGGLYLGAGSDVIIAYFNKLTFTIVYWIKNLSEEIIFVVFKLLYLCWWLTFSMLKIDKYTAFCTVRRSNFWVGLFRVHSQFWNLLKTCGWDFTWRWDHTWVSTVL